MNKKSFIKLFNGIYTVYYKETQKGDKVIISTTPEGFTHELNVYMSGNKGWYLKETNYITEQDIEDCLMILSNYLHRDELEVR